MIVPPRIRVKRHPQHPDTWIDDTDSDLIRHDPPRTKLSHPYSFDPFTIWGDPKPDPRCNGSDYTDRMSQWDYKRYDELVKAIYKPGGEWQDPFDSYNCRGDLIEQFLRRWYDDPGLQLLRVIAYCNVSTGYPTWRLDYIRCE